MKNNSNPQSYSKRIFTVVLFITMAVLNLFVSANACAQSKKEKARLAKVTFMDEYVRKANEKADAEYAKLILENLPSFVAPVAVKHVNYMQPLPDGRYLFVRYFQNTATGDHIQLIKTDADGNIQWERTFQGDGFSNEADNFMKHTRDGGYLIQRSICNSNSNPSALTQVTATE
jgi:hypothetical protein